MRGTASLTVERARRSGRNRGLRDLHLHARHRLSPRPGHGAAVVFGADGGAAEKEMRL
jgi:hypothetical protein